MTLYSLTKKTFRTILSEQLQTKLWSKVNQMARSQNPLAQKILEFERIIAKTAKHDDIYSANYFKNDVEPAIKKSAPVMAETIISGYSPKTVVDVGCGTGMLLLELKQRGVEVFGLEYAKAGIEICRSRGLSVQQFDIESAVNIEKRADLVISTEVAEHLPEACADKYVDILCSIANNVLVTAAPPGQGGYDHVNEQPNEYWIAKFLERGFKYEKKLTMQLRNEWKEANVAYWYSSNVMLFIK